MGGRIESVFIFFYIYICIFKIFYNYLLVVLIIKKIDYLLG